MQDKNTWSRRLLPPYLFIAVGKLAGQLLGLRVKAYRILGLEAPGDEVHASICSRMTLQTSQKHHFLASLFTVCLRPLSDMYLTITYFTFSLNSYYHLAGGVFYLLICLSLPVECKL